MAADILRTGLSPAQDDILVLIVIVGVPTVLNYLLELELASLALARPAVADHGKMAGGSELMSP